MSIRGVQSNAISPRHTQPKAETLSPQSTWARNPTWPTLPSVTSSDEKFVGLYAVYPDAAFIALNALTDSGGYTVDWGDGSAPQNYNSNTIAYYQYTYNASGIANTEGPVTFTASGSTVDRTAHGYTNGTKVSFATIVTTTEISAGQIYYVVNATANTFQVSATYGGSALTLTNNGSGTLLPYQIATVTVTPQSGKKITKLDLNIKHNQSGLQTGYASGWLDLALSLPNLTSGTTLVFSASTANVTNEMLQSASILNIGACTSLAYLFNACRVLKKVSITATTTSVTDCSSMFLNCYSLVTVPLFNTSAVTSMNGMLNSCYSLVTVPLFNTAAVTTMSAMLNSCYSLVTVPLFNTAAVTTMSNMFNTCVSLVTVPLFNTAAVTSMGSMFTGCRSLTSVPLFNTSSVTTMANMFVNCVSLTTVPLLNTASVTNMDGMFNNCNSLVTVPLFNTVSATSMNSMFITCSSLASIPLFNTTAVTNMSNIFSGCSSLIAVPLFNTAAVTAMGNMFSNCVSLAAVPALNCSAVTTGNFASIFSGCVSLSSVGSTGISFSISVANCKLSAAKLDAIFTNLPSVSGQTITITGNYGAGTCTQSIATGKGWTVAN